MARPASAATSWVASGTFVLDFQEPVQGLLESLVSPSWTSAESFRGILEVRSVVWRGLGAV
eukprot:4834378-Pyramimonas_sp.AAC.1